MSDAVSIVSCESYEKATVTRALSECLEPLGGLDLIKPGTVVAIKANLVSMMKPESAATTHPSLLVALTEALVGRGAEVIVGDSPGGLYNSVFLNRVYAVTGVREVEKVGGRLNQDFSEAIASFPEGLVCRNFQYTAWLDSADVIIDFCKLKSHGMMGMSAAAKNMFGVVPGTFKPEYHYRFPKHTDFAKMILDLNAYFAPKMKLCICDAVVGMEGNGPTQGTPRKVGALLASASPHALDLVCADLIGLTPADVPTLEVAVENGLIPDSVSGLTLYGDPAPFRISDYRNIHVHGSLQFEGAGKFASTFIRSALKATPRPDKKSCVGCAKCANICPAKAITMVNKVPKIDTKVCITCFCCQEFCPVGAMKVHRPLIARLINKTAK